MSEFVFGFKSPTYEVQLQIPVCLLGKPDPDVLPNLKKIVGQTTSAEEEPVEEKKSTGFFTKKTVVEKEEKSEKTKDGEGLTIATGVLLLSSMILAALKD